MSDENKEFAIVEYAKGIFNASREKYPDGTLLYTDFEEFIGNTD